MMMNGSTASKKGNGPKFIRLFIEVHLYNLGVLPRSDYPTSLIMDGDSDGLMATQALGRTTAVVDDRQNIISFCARYARILHDNI